MVRASSTPDLVPSAEHPQSLNYSVAEDGRSRASSLFPYALLVAFIVASVLPWWNRYIAVTNDAWHYFYGLQIFHGLVPYRDFYLFVPPLYPLKNALLIALFGNRLLVPHIMATVEIVVVSIILVDWLRRLWPTFEATAAVTIAMALYIFCMRSETLGGLHQETIVFPVITAWAACLAICRPRLRLYLLAGICAGLSALAKQNSGLVTVVCVGPVLAVLLWRLYGRRTAIAAAATYALGVCLPVGLTCAWLARNGALSAFLQDVFTKGAFSKGSVLDILLRPFAMIVHDFHFQVQLAAAVLCLGAFFWLAGWQEPAAPAEPREANSRLARFFIAMFAALLVGVGLSRYFDLSRLSSFYQTAPADILLFSGEIGCAVLLLHAVRAWLRDPLELRNAQYLLTCAVSVSLAYALGWSWVNYTPIMVPSLAVFLAYVLTALNLPRLRWSRNLVLLGCVLAVAGYCLLRMDRPFAWGGWAEPSVWTATRRLPEPELAGFRVSPQSAYFVNRVTQDIVANSRPGDRVLAYPDIPIFYILAHRSPDSFAYVHWMDVAPDYIDHADAGEILRHPPAVIVYLVQPDAPLRLAEALFREGHRSGVRDIIAAIDSLRPEYHTVETFASRTGDEFVVLARNRGNAQSTPR